MSAVFPPVKENIYILSWPCVPGLPESLPRGGRRGPSGTGGFRQRPQGGRAVGGAWLCPHQAPGTSPRRRDLPATPALGRSTSHSSKGASLTAPHETIIHYVTRREERECKCLDGIRGNPRRDDLGAVIIHLIGAWGKLLDREMELNQPRKGA